MVLLTSAGLEVVGTRTLMVAKVVVAVSMVGGTDWGLEERLFLGGCGAEMWMFSVVSLIMLMSS